MTIERESISRSLLRLQTIQRGLNAEVQRRLRLLRLLDQQLEDEQRSPDQPKLPIPEATLRVLANPLCGL